MSSNKKQASKNNLYIAGVFGYPVKHSLSPAMQNAAFRNAGLTVSYLPFEVKPEEAAFLIKKLAVLGVTGINLTVPHKEVAYKNVDFLSKEAKIFQAVNTITVKKGKLYGASTDGEGLRLGLKNEVGMEIKNKSIIILGAGGAGRSAAIYLAVKGAKRIIISNRTRNKALTAVKLIRKFARRSAVICGPLTEDFVKKYAAGSDLIINATSLGLKPKDKPAVGSKAFRKGIVFYDMIYSPALTSTMKAAKRAGARVYNGLSMLLYQGAISWELWTGKKAPVKIMQKALLKELKNRTNKVC